MVSSPDINKYYEKIRPQDQKTQASAELRSLAYYEANLLPTLRSFSSKQIQILELGPGTGLLAKWLRQLGYKNYTSIEACRSYVELLRDDGFSCVYSSEIPKILNEDLKTQSFDLVLAVDMLEHVDNQEAVRILGALEKKLKPNGQVLIQVPNVSAMFGWNTQASDPTHMAIFNENSLRASFRAAGFSDIEIRAVRLPKGFLNVLRATFREFLFSFQRALMRLTGAPSVQVMTHLMLGIAKKS